MDTPAAAAAQCRTLSGACVAHVVHDYTDLAYVLLPVWQQQFGLSYVALAMLRCFYSGTMGGLQLPGDPWTRRIGGRRALVGRRWSRPPATSW